MSSAPLRPRDRRWRRYFRRCRIAVLLAVLAVVGALIYLDLVGLPEFLQRPLLAELRKRGLDLQFSNLRLHFYRGIVAQDVRADRLGEPASPRFAAREADLNLSWPALRHFRIEVSAVVLREGRLSIPILDPSQTNRALVVDNMRVHLRFLANDSWSLDDFHAEFAGAAFSLTGVITNASALRDWRFAGVETTAPATKPPPGLIQQRLRRFADTLKQIRFHEKPEMRAMLSGDARQIESMVLRLTVSAPDAKTPWGEFSSGTLMARLLPAARLENRRAEIELKAAHAKTPWAEVADLHLNLLLHAHEADTNLLVANASLGAAQVLTRWANGTNVQFTANWLHSLTNAIPLSGHGELQATTATSRWATAHSLRLSTWLDPANNALPSDASWAWWQHLQPFRLGWTAQARRVQTEAISADDVEVDGNWAAPTFELTNFHAAFPEGPFSASAKLNVPQREASFAVNSGFDVHRVDPLLTEKARAWLARFSWQVPPQLSGSGLVTLPAWTNRQPDWREEVLPTLKLAAFVSATNCAYLRVPADWVTTHLSFTNLVWHLPDLVAGRPEGRLQLAHLANDDTHEFWFGLHSTISPEALRPVLSTNAQRGLDLFELTTPPVVQGEVRGRWRDPSSIGFSGTVALEDFAFREQTASRFVSSLKYTNRFLEFQDVRLERGTQTVTVAGAAVDFPGNRVYLTNAYSTAEPLVIARGIGPKTAEAIEPYRFLSPPTVVVNGYAALHGNTNTDLHFDVDGGPFEWWNFKIPHISGQVHWLGDWLTLSNVAFEAYDGWATGNASFDFRANPGTDFQFALAATNADLRLLMRDVLGRTNHLEGRVSGRLLVNRANTEDKFTWNGGGDAELRDGLIWAIPIFGALSKPLDSVFPGLGNARITEGTSQFVISNGVIHSDKLEMRAPAARLQCNGTVDFDARVNLRVTAAPLRGAVGALLTVPLWPLSKLFEYHVTGTLNEPKLAPVYIPSLLMNPFRIFENVFSLEPGKTNPPPVFKEVP